MLLPRKWNNHRWRGGANIQKRMVVDLLQVEKTRRNRGLGSSLLQSMEQVARERGCRDTLLETLSASAARLNSAAEYHQPAQIADCSGVYQTCTVQIVPLAPRHVRRSRRRRLNVIRSFRSAIFKRRRALVHGLGIGSTWRPYEQPAGTSIRNIPQRTFPTPRAG
jgi:hypothetical protein